MLLFNQYNLYLTVHRELSMIYLVVHAVSLFLRSGLSMLKVTHDFTEIEGSVAMVTNQRAIWLRAELLDIHKTASPTVFFSNPAHFHSRMLDVIA